MCVRVCVCVRVCRMNRIWDLYFRNRCAPQGLRTLGWEQTFSSNRVKFVSGECPPPGCLDPSLGAQGEEHVVLLEEHVTGSVSASQGLVPDGGAGSPRRTQAAAPLKDRLIAP